MPELKSLRAGALCLHALLLTVGTAGCSTFSSVRSAAVRPGATFSGQASASTRPGAEAGWFFTPYCVSACNYHLVGAEVAFAYGWDRGGGARPVAVGFGINSFFPFVEGYVQLSDATEVQNPWGVGARVGIPIRGWRQHQLYGRYDVPLEANKTLLLNPGIVVHHGGSRYSGGSVVAFVQGVGVEYAGPTLSITPSFSAVVSRAQRTDFGIRNSPETRLFATASLGVAFYGRR